MFLFLNTNNKNNVNHFFFKTVELVRIGVILHDVCVTNVQLNGGKTKRFTIISFAD